MSPRTKKNLMTAMKCDAFDAAKYSRFAAHARMCDDWELAQMFQETADSDRTDHFAKEAELEGLVAASPENLRNAIDTEMREIAILYQFASEATEDGDLEAAAAFEKISHHKAARCARFNVLLEKMGVHSNVESVGS